ncbi:PREDICTED: factor of DNA methylation 4-like isoform X2 [Ipomoea nil]|uniref:factor of DNA methylation 4-like isoform X2 n=1 Tax=Ipomoea nil TaxID=35883 RepID=UPI000901EB35|nr:PREDICTED: factor of DNA methylation 4-like isoform X2 [Ipomoea nil]
MPYRRKFELRDCSNSKLEDLKCRYYKDLRDREDRIRGSGEYFRCPYCRDKRGKEYDMQGLLRHSYRIGYASKSSSLREKARHLGLLKYLERHRYAKSNARHPLPIDPSTNGANEETFVWPWMGIIANIPVVYKDGKFVDKSGQKLKMELVAKGYNPVKVYTLLTNRGFSGYAIVEFNCDFSGFANAMAFAWEFELDKHGKQEWYSSLKDESDDNLYAWIAGKEEYDSNSILGNYLRRNGDLRTISEIQNESRRENSQLFSNLINELESKYKECEEMEKMISNTEVVMINVMKEKVEILAMQNKELEMIHQEALKQVETILSEQETSKQQLDDHEKELKLREDEIRQREKLNESEKMKLDCEKEMNERAILAQTKAYETMMKLADEQKREKEQALDKICRLERELDQKPGLDLEIEMYKGAFEIWRNMNDMIEGDLTPISKLLEELKEKDDELDYLECMHYELTIEHQRVDDQVQDVCNVMINGLKDSRANICVKRIGEIDVKPVIRAAKLIYPKEEALDIAFELRFLWEEYLRDPGWHPFTVIENGRKDVWVIDEEDGKLVGLRNDYGDEVYNSATTALMELDEYNSTGRYPVSVLWNTKEKRIAELKEGIDQILKQLRGLMGRQGADQILKQMRRLMGRQGSSDRDA